MATGDINFSTRGQEVSKFDRSPPKVSDYEYVLHTAGAKIQKSDGPDKLPYIGNLYAELLGTAPKEGQPNKRVYCSIFLSLKPGKDGVVAPNRQSGLTALARSLGEEAEVSGSTITVNKVEYDADGNKTISDDTEDVAILSPSGVLELLKSWDGKSGKLRTKMRKGRDGEAPQGEVDYFIESDSPSSAGFEDEPAPEPVKKAAPAKAASKPAAKKR